MPFILPPETHEQWLSGESGKQILRPFPAEEMIARPISKRINKSENNDPMVFKVGIEAQKHWRRLNGSALLPKVVTRRSIYRRRGVRTTSCLTVMN
jgi:hypothetical protein